MIDRWLLPGPAALVATLVADLIEGRQLVLRAAPQPGLRRAVEDELGRYEQSLRVIYDGDGDPPGIVLRRAIAEGLAPAAALLSGIYWVDAVEPGRAALWAAEVAAMAQAAHNREPGNRALLAVPLPPREAAPHGLGIVDRRVEPLGRSDLKVAACYALQPGSGAGLLDRIRAALTEELAAPLLPGFAALDALDFWLGLPESALADPAQLAAHAAGTGLALPAPCRLKLAVWRAQAAVLNAEIEEERLRLVDAGRALWHIPYTHPAADERPEKSVRDADLLELTHLCRQVKERGLPRNHPLRDRLFALRDARNALSHLEPLNAAELAALMRQGS